MTRSMITPQDRPTGRSASVFVPVAFAAAPALLLAYGVIRLLDGLDGSRGPGPAWTVGHLAFLASALVFVPVSLELRRRVAARTAGRRIAVNVSAVLAVLGLAATVAQAVIDLVAGLRATDRAGMNAFFQQVQSYPGVELAVYAIGPPLFHVGLIALVVLLATLTPRRLAWWSPVLVVVGTAASAIDLDLIPLGAACVWLALAPPAWSLGRDAVKAAVARA